MVSSISKAIKKSNRGEDDEEEGGKVEERKRRSLDSMTDEERRARSKEKKKVLKQKGRLVPSTKNRMRSMERTLARRGDRIPEDIKAGMRSKIEKLREDYGGVKLAEKERNYALRYRRVKFFERKKLQRKLAKNSKELEDEGLSSKDRRKLEKKRELIVQDLQYVTYFPRDMKYVSIFQNAREVIDKLRNSEGFEGKMERARQIVLAYRASKLSQQQEGKKRGSESEKAADVPKKKAKKEASVDKVIVGDKDAHEAKDKKKNKKKKEQEDEEEEDKIPSEASVSDEKAWMQQMRDEQNRLLLPGPQQHLNL